MRIKHLKGFENIVDIYTIDKSGNVYSEVKGGFLNVTDNSYGYKMVSLKIEGKRKWKKAYIHRLVALAFIPNLEELPEVNHIDENKDNNNVENLEWISRLDNVRHGTGTKRQVLKRTKKVYVYDYLLNFIGEYQGMNQATKDVLGYSQAKVLNKRTKEHFFVNDPITIEKAEELNLTSAYQTVVIEDVITKEKRYFCSNRDARAFFDNKVNITDAIKNKWLVRKKYRIYPLDYNELKDSPNLHE